MSSKSLNKRIRKKVNTVRKYFLNSLIKRIKKKVNAGRKYFLDNLNEKIKVIIWNTYSLFWKSKKLLIFRKTLQGKFYIPPNCASIGSSLFLRSNYELKTITAVIDFLISQKYLLCSEVGVCRGTILDIGANIGTVSIGMIYKNYFDRAIAIEADLDNFNILRKNIRLNNFEKQIKPICCAVSDNKSEVPFLIYKDFAGAHHITKNFDANGKRNIIINKKTNTLDNLIKETDEFFTKEINLVWMDIEGYEIPALKGGGILLERNIPFVIEFYPALMLERAGLSREECIAFFKSNWKYFWIVKSNLQFVKQHIEEINVLFDELLNNKNNGAKPYFTNILLAKN